MYTAASPITHVSSSSPPVLLLHGDSEHTVPFEQSVPWMPLKQGQCAREAGARDWRRTRPNFGTDGKPHPELPKVFDETVAWLDAHLKGAAQRHEEQR